MNNDVHNLHTQFNGWVMGGVGGRASGGVGESRLDPRFRFGTDVAAGAVPSGWSSWIFAWAAR